MHVMGCGAKARVWRHRPNHLARPQPRRASSLGLWVRAIQPSTWRSYRPAKGFSASRRAANPTSIAIFFNWSDYNCGFEAFIPELDNVLETGGDDRRDLRRHVDRWQFPHC